MNIKRKMLIAVCLMVAIMGEAVEKQTASINKVTVFTNGAQVERSKSVILVPGEQVDRWGRHSMVNSEHFSLFN